MAIAIFINWEREGEQKVRVIYGEFPRETGTDARSCDRIIPDSLSRVNDARNIHPAVSSSRKAVVQLPERTLIKLSACPLDGSKTSVYIEQPGWYEKREREREKSFISANGKRLNSRWKISPFAPSFLFFASRFSRQKIGIKARTPRDDSPSIESFASIESPNISLISTSWLGEVEFEMGHELNDRGRF